MGNASAELEKEKASGGSRPSDKGGGGGHPKGGMVLKKNFSALRASVSSKNKGGLGPPGPLPWIHHGRLLKNWYVSIKVKCKLKVYRAVLFCLLYGVES